MKTDNRDQFLKQLNQLVVDTKERNNRGNRAALRRYWSPTTRHQSYPLLGQLGALRVENIIAPKAILAALYAEHPQHQNGQTVGKAARLLGKDPNGEHPFERQFRRLLACDTLEDLAHQLHRLTKRLQRDNIGLDYQSLLINLFTWAKSEEPQKRDDVKFRWAADFWQAPVSQITMEVAES